MLKLFIGSFAAEYCGPTATTPTSFGVKVVGYLSSGLV